MAGRSREEVLARYRRLREISTRHQSEALGFVPHATLLEQARRIGLTAGKTLVAESMDELTLASAGVVPGSDEDVMLQAMRQARFSVWRVERRHETAGFIVQDLMREERVWLLDENLERTASVGMPLAMRVSTPDAFTMTCGMSVPVDAVPMDEIFEEVLRRVQGEPDAIANNRRFATALHRIAIRNGILDQVGFVDPG